MISLPRALLYVALSIAVLIGLVVLAKESYGLATNGVNATGTVISSNHFRKRKYSVERVVVRYGGNRRIFDMDDRLRPGDKVYVRYMPNDPSIARVSQTPFSFFKIMSAPSPYMWLVFGGGTIIFLLQGLLGVYGHVRSRSTS